MRVQASAMAVACDTCFLHVFVRTCEELLVYLLQAAHCARLEV